jgi:DNA-binding transcriptional LysR family regulator
LRRDLDIRPLRTLVTIVDLGGFRKAAEALNISQPAVSQHIRRLGSLIGEPVFRTTGQALALSTMGEELLRYARQLVHTNDDLVLHLNAQQRQRRLALGVCGTLVGVVPDLLASLQRHRAVTMLTVHTGSGDRLHDQLTHGTVDMVLRLGQAEGEKDRTIGEIQCAWFGPAVLLDNGPLPVAVFADEPSPLRQLTDETLTEASLPWRTVYEGVGMEDMVKVLRADFAVGLLFAAAEQLWRLPPLPASALPRPVRPLPVTLTVGPRVTASLAETTFEAVTDAMRGYTVSDMQPSRRL